MNKEFSFEAIHSLPTELLNTVLDTIPVGIEVLRAVRKENRIVDFEYMLVNKVMQTYSGTDSKEKSFLALNGDKKLFTAMVNVTEDGINGHNKVSFTAEKEVRRFKVNLVKFEDGVLLCYETVSSSAQTFAKEKRNIAHLPGTAPDKTEMVMAELKFKEQSHYLQRILQTVPDMISVTELETSKFDYLNKETFRAQNFDPDRLNAMNPEERNELIHPEDRRVIAEYFQKFPTASDDDIITAEYKAKDDNGQWKWILVRGRVFQRNETGTVTHVLNVTKDISERKKFEQSLKESYDLLQSVFDSTTNGISVLESVRNNKGQIIDFRYVYANAMTETINRRYDLVGKLYSEVHKGLKKTGLFSHLTQVVETGATGKMEIFYNEEGFNNWFSIVAVKLKDGVVLSFEDITERMKAERKIKENAHLINQIVETSPDIIYILDLNTLQIIYTNRAIAEMLGYSRQQIAEMKNPFIDLLHEDDKAAMLDHQKKIKTLGNDDKTLEIEYRLKNAKGGVNWFCDRNSVFKRNQRNVPVETIGICQDITQRKLEEEKKITSLNILEQTEKISPIGSWEYYLESGVFKWSDGMYRLFNLAKDTDITPKIYLEYCAPEYKTAAQRIVSNITLEFQDFEGLIGILPPEQDKKIIKIKAVLLKDKNKNPVKVIGIDLDITQQVKASNEINDLYGMLMKKHEDLEMLNTELKTFNTIASRDYKETLQILYTNLEYIVSKDGLLLSDTSKANIRRAQSAIQRMKLLTDDINNYLQLHDIGISKTLINTNELIKNLLDSMHEKLERVNAKVEYPQLPHLYTDPFLFALLIKHLIDNSIKFRKLISSPVINIKYSLADEMNAVTLAIRDMPYIIISLSDNGIGFDEEHADKIFDLFYIIDENRKNKGSGIGLAICKKIMQMYGGFITAEGTSAQGATFNCYFPAK